MNHPLVLAITGASGAIYGVRLLEVLLAAGRAVYLTISPSGQAVLETELGLKVDLDDFLPSTLTPAVYEQQCDGQLHYCHYQDLMSPIASGSFLTDGMIVCPCSGSTLGAVAHSIGSNLIHRAAEVHLKERRKLILVPRELRYLCRKLTICGGPPRLVQSCCPRAQGFITEQKRSTSWSISSSDASAISLVSSIG